MTLAAKKMREAVLQLLYCKEIAEFDKSFIVPFMMKELSISRKNVFEAVDMVEKIWQKREQLDQKLAEYVQTYAFDRIQKLEKTALRLGLYELENEQDLPAAVSISEALRLTRKFSTPQAAHFVNALLDSIYQKSNGENLQESIKALEESEDIAQQASQESKEVDQDDGS